MSSEFFDMLENWVITLHESIASKTSIFEDKSKFNDVIEKKRFIEELASINTLYSDILLLQTKHDSHVHYFTYGI